MDKNNTNNKKAMNEFVSALNCGKLLLLRAYNEHISWSIRAGGPGGWCGKRIMLRGKIGITKKKNGDDEKCRPN